MKPEMPLQRPNYEQPPILDSRVIERAPSNVGPESSINLGGERYEKKSESGASIVDVNYATSLPNPVVVSDQSVNDNRSTGDNPAVANDDDLIEKEWVDKAKKIIADTRDNPHQREKAVNDLQVDYLKKRYGRELGITD